MYMPDTLLTKYYGQVPESQNSNTAGGYIFPCTATLPSLTIVMGGYKAVVPGMSLSSPRPLTAFRRGASANVSDRLLYQL